MEKKDTKTQLNSVENTSVAQVLENTHEIPPIKTDLNKPALKSGPLKACECISDTVQDEEGLVGKYFASTDHPDIDRFLDYACDAMFLGYLVKSLMAIRRKYIIRLMGQEEKEFMFDMLSDIAGNSKEDEYQCFFESMISRLTEKQKQCLRYSFRDGLTDRMIARIMGVRPQSVYDIKNAALKKLRKELGDAHSKNGL
jgi:DNA-binding NarL/FixJ family response regulator